MTEYSFIYAGDLNAEVMEIEKLVAEDEIADQKDTFSVTCGAILSIYCC